MPSSTIIMLNTVETWDKRLRKYQLIAFLLQHVIIALLFTLWRSKKVFSFPFFLLLPRTGALHTQRKAHALPQWPYPALKPDMTVRMTNNGREGWEEGSKITQLHSLAICLTWCIGLQLNLEIFPQWENSFHGAQIYLREVNLLQKQPKKKKKKENASLSAWAFFSLASLSYFNFINTDKICLWIKFCNYQRTVISHTEPYPCPGLT